MSDPLAKIREQVKSGKVKPAKPKPITAASNSVAPRTGPITHSELEIIYGRGSREPGTHSHSTGLQAVYEAGATGKRA